MKPNTIRTDHGPLNPFSPASSKQKSGLVRSGPAVVSRSDPSSVNPQPSSLNPGQSGSDPSSFNPQPSSLIKFRPYQAEAFHNKTDGIQIWLWGRQTGKSFTLAAW